MARGGGGGGGDGKPNPAGFFSRHQNIFLYVPNLIGYARLAAVIYSFAIAFVDPLRCLAFYFLSFACDELDGRFARMLGQTSTLGAVLDMVTDRLATTGLLLILAAQHSQLVLPAILLIFLDIFSHWFQMYTSMLLGAASHKDTGSRSWLVSFYYSNRIFMGFCCVCCEVLYLSAYALAFPSMRAFRTPVPFELAEPFPHYLPDGLADALFSSAGVPYLSVLLFAAVPGFLVKQLCNWVQLRAAAISLVEYDLKRMK
eukprot:356917-Chlamydomonas_euryale.AAC.6